MRRAPLLVLLAACSLVGCSKSAEPGSCYRAQENACVEYAADRAAAGRRICSGMTWRAGEGSCPAEDRLGTCTTPSGAEHLYAGAPNHYTSSSAKSACEGAGGTFAPSNVPR